MLFILSISTQSLIKAPVFEPIKRTKNSYSISWKPLIFTAIIIIGLIYISSFVVEAYT